MPERVFEHPVARALVEQRKLLIGDSGLRAVVARAMAAIGLNPAQYADDPTVFLSLRVGSLRSMQATAENLEAVVDDVQGLMWETALRIEDGRMSAPTRTARADGEAAGSARQQRARRRDRTIDARIAGRDRPASARDDRTGAAQSQPNRQPQDRNAERMERQDLQKLLDQARQLARTARATRPKRSCRACSRCSRTCASSRRAAKTGRASPATARRRK